MTIGLVAWLAVLFFILIYDIWAWRTEHQTLTDAARRIQMRWTYFRWILLIGFTVLWWHFFAFSFS